MIFQQYHAFDLSISHWQLEPGQCWAVLGRNGSGKKRLAQAIVSMQELPEFKEHRFSVLSFEQQQILYEEELKNDNSDFMDRPDPGSMVRELLNTDERNLTNLRFLGLEKLLDRGYRQLSSGESRKVLLAKAILEKPDYLILDEPYDSLDQQSKFELNTFFSDLSKQQETQLIFLLNNLDEISEWHSHLAILEKGELIAQGERADLLKNQDLHALLDFDATALPEWPESLQETDIPDPLIELTNGKVSYGENIIFSSLNLSINVGEHTLFTGPNGAGKSTLLHLITGDHPQCYGNDLRILGVRRGSGESIWQLKKFIGIVSPELHRNHRVPGSALEITLSGFFDSIGLYESISSNQVDHAKRWLCLVGLENKMQVSFKALSYGEQRLVLIARALVKQPALLICDEPTQGLDNINRHRFIYFLQHLATQSRTTILMASHRQDENLSLFKHHVRLEIK
jgi:molybdate transport system ATP-binding protein